jgi:hypothetical protein
MKIKKNIATSENGFIFNPATGDSFSGNAMASVILLAMKNGVNTAEIKADILKNTTLVQRSLIGIGRIG